MSDNKTHIYHERVEAIRKAILEACVEHDVTKEQLLSDLLLLEDLQEHDLNRDQKPLD